MSKFAMATYVKNIILISIFATFLLASCGKKGPVYPPNKAPEKKDYSIHKK